MPILSAPLREPPRGRKRSGVPTPPPPISARRHAEPRRASLAHAPLPRPPATRRPPQHPPPPPRASLPGRQGFGAASKTSPNPRLQTTAHSKHPHPAQAEHERAVDSHELLLVHLVRLVQDDAHLVVVPAQRRNHLRAGARPTGSGRSRRCSGLGWCLTFLAAEEEDPCRLVMAVNRPVMQAAHTPAAARSVGECTKRARTRTALN